MNNLLNDSQLADLIKQGCNAAEIAAYTGTTEAVATFRMQRVMQRLLYRKPDPIPSTRAHAHLPEDTTP